MDLLTQAVLGASVGEVCLGKKLGNKAILWGAIGGLIPDTDAISYVLFELPYADLFHRGFMHSILFTLLFTPILALIGRRFHIKTGVHYRDWLIFSFWVLLTHPLLDYFTSYGTGAFEPFNHYRIAFNSVNVVDLFYTLNVSKLHTTVI